MLRLRQLREEKRVPQRVIAELIGTSVVSVARYEAGDYEPSINALSLMADYFGVTIDYLVGRSDNRTGTPPEVTAAEPPDPLLDGLSSTDRAFIEAFVDALLAHKKD